MRCALRKHTLQVVWVYSQNQYKMRKKTCQCTRRQIWWPSLKKKNVEREVQTNYRSFTKAKLANAHNIRKWQKRDDHSEVRENGQENDKHCNAATSTPVFTGTEMMDGKSYRRKERAINDNEERTMISQNTLSQYAYQKIENRFWIHIPKNGSGSLQENDSKYSILSCVPSSDALPKAKSGQRAAPLQSTAPETSIIQPQEIFHHRSMTLQTWIFFKMRLIQLEDSLPQQISAFAIDHTGDAIGEKMDAKN